jgi:hypothetical protein
MLSPSLGHHNFTYSGVQDLGRITTLTMIPEQTTKLLQKFSAEIVLEDMAMLDSNMPKDVKQALDFQNTQQV